MAVHYQYGLTFSESSQTYGCLVWVISASRQSDAMVEHQASANTGKNHP
jgi:hypothetical protein